MDQSANAGMTGSQHPGNPSYPFLHGIHQYSTDHALQNGQDDFNTYFDPELFVENTSMGYSQPQPQSQNSNQNVSRQTNSPGFAQYNPSPSPFSHPQFQQSFYEPQQLSQPGFDPRFNHQPSQSPVSFEPFQYHSNMNYNYPTYNPQHVGMPQSQSPAPAATYPSRPQPPQMYANIGRQPSQLSQVQNHEMMNFGGYPDQNQQPSNTYVNPSSLLNSTPMTSTHQNNNNFQNFQSYGVHHGFKDLSALDPLSMQTMPGLQPLAPSPAPAPTSVPAPAAPQQMTIQPKPAAVTAPKVPKDPKAPRAPRSKVKKAAAAGKTVTEVSSDEVSDSEDELSVEDQVPPEPTPSVLIDVLPADEREKAHRKAIEAVWTPRNRSAPAEKVRKGIADFGDAVRSLRDAWKAKNDSLKKAELPQSSTAAEAAALKADVAQYRSTMEVAMAQSLFYGHPAIVKRLGENQFTMSALYSFMLDRFTAEDFDSPLINNILKFVVRFETLTSEMLEMTKWSKLLQRLVKKATNDSKSLAQGVLNNAAVATKKKAAAAAAGDAKGENTGSPASVDSPTDGLRRDGAAGAKRMRDGESAAPPAKKIIKSSKPLALQHAELQRKKALEASQAAKVEGIKADATKIDKAAVSASTATPAARGKVAVAAPPKSAVFSSLLSASKKPGTSNAARAAAAIKEKATATATAPSSTVVPAKKDPSKRGSPPRNVASAARPASSFLGLLADMEKKPEKPVQKEKEIPNETEEEKAKRLRKEARRKLRVSWKPDTDLVETRFFTHDPDEEIGAGDDRKRDAGNTAKEGEALKHHHGAEDLDEDEDEDSFEELEEYILPSEVDFSVLKTPDLIEMTGSNTVKTGGDTKAESPSSEAQDKLEQETLMATFTSKLDRPPTPKEPDDNGDEGDFEPCTDMGEPNDMVRGREREFSARKQQPAQGPIGGDLASRLAALSNPQPAPTSIIPPELQHALSRLGGQPQPPLQQQPTPPPQAAPPPQFDLQKLLASVQQVQHVQQQQQYQPPPQPVNPPVDLSAFLASLAQPQAQQQQNLSPITLGTAASSIPFLNAADDNSRKHGRTDSGDYDEGRKSGAKKSKNGDTDKSGKPYNYKTVTCSFWKQGKCLKGDTCTFRHDDD